jgi:BirA family biotin operon repressor/biotin-[acetyl-CoA-carboxylase] ligase
VFDLARISASGLVDRIDYHESLPSTNDRALEMAAHGDVKLPLLVLAERQTAGRGRGANRWWSADGALTFSLVVEADAGRLPPDRRPQVALVAGLAVCEALQSLAPSADMRVKWPNDVYLGGRKVCGILSESVPGWRDRLVVGIGINVNNSFQEPRVAGLNETATSLIDHDGVSRNLTSTLVEVLDRFDFRWREFLGGCFPSLAGQYRQRCFLTGRTVTIEQADGARHIGLCRGIDDDGALCMRSEMSEFRAVSGTISHWE